MKHPFRMFSGLFVLLAFARNATALTYVLYSPSTFTTNTPALNAALGIAGLTYNDFQVNALVGGLNVSTTNPASGPTTVLANIYNQAAEGVFTNNLWAGGTGLVNTVNNGLWCCGGPTGQIATAITLTMPPSTVVGFGMGNFQSDVVDHAVFVNGQAQPLIPVIGNLPGFVSVINGLNGYLVITAGPGETIASVTIQQYVKGTLTVPADNISSTDGLIFSHVAFGSPSTGTSTSVPLPNWALVALATGCVGIGWRRVKTSA